MNTDVLSIASALKRNGGPVTLIVIELTALMAILCNVLFLVSDYARLTTLQTGVSDNDIAFIERVGVVGSAGTFGDTFGTYQEAMSLLKSVPGVTAAAYAQVPFWANDAAVFLTPGQRTPTTLAYDFFGSQSEHEVLGVHLLAGHFPTNEELPKMDDLKPDLQAAIVVTQALAQDLFPGGGAIDKVIYVTTPLGGVIPAHITGIIENIRGNLYGTPKDARSFLLEAYFNKNAMGGWYAIRTRPGQGETVLQAAKQVLARHDQGTSVIMRTGTVAQRRALHFADTVSNIWTLVIVLGVLSLLAVCGLTALTSFWVQRRRLHIGIRRALGATRGNIVHYFLVENALIVGMGVGIGAVMALALNHLLVQLYAIPQLPLGYLFAAGGLLLVFGQLAALAPALRAAATPPSTALRATC